MMGRDPLGAGRLEIRQLQLEQMLFQSGALTNVVYFPTSGVVSTVSLTEDGESIEVAVVGREGVVGYWLALGILHTPWDAMVQGEGEALVMAADDFLVLIQQEPEFREAVLHYCGAILTVAAQTIVCNRFHELPSRLARWLLLMHDRLPGDEFRVTHQFMGLMLGVHRPAVTVALRALSGAGIVKQSARSHLLIIDRLALEDAACECYERARGMAEPSR